MNSIIQIEIYQIFFLNIPITISLTNIVALTVQTMNSGIHRHVIKKFQLPVRESIQNTKMYM